MAGRKLPDRITNLPRVGSRATDERADRIRQQGGEVLALSAYPDRAMPEEILRAAWSCAATREHPPARWLPSLRKALAEYLEGRCGRTVDPDSQILITGGAMHALLCAMMAIVDPGDEVLLFTPSYFFEGSITLSGARMVSLPLHEEVGFRWRVDLLERAVTPRTRAVLLNTPTNPSGIVADRDCLESIARLAERHELFVVCDETYDQLVYDGRQHETILSVSANRERNLLIGSFTKSFAMAPWRVGYVVASSWVIDAILKVLEWTWLFGPYVNQKLAELVLRSDRKWLAGVKDDFQANRDQLAADLAYIPDLTFRIPQGNPFLFLNAKRYASDDCMIGSRLLEEYGIPCTPGHLHGSPGYIRIPFGGQIETIREAGRRMRIAFEEFGRER